MKNSFTLGLMVAISLASCQSGNQKSAEELAEQEQFKLDSIAAIEMNDENYDENFGDGPSDDEIQEYGLFTEVKESGYPIYNVTVEFPEREMTISFTVNIEESGISGAYLEGLKDKYATFYYTSELENDLYEMLLDNKSVLGIDAIEIKENLKTVTGILSGAASETTSDLPGLITIAPKSGDNVIFELYVNSEMVPANGKEVTAYFATRGKQEITFIKISE